MVFSIKKKVLSAFMSLAMIGTMVAAVPFTASAATTATTTKDVHVSYMSQVQHIGWQAAVSDGALSGSTGKAYRDEAISFALTGADVPTGAYIEAQVQGQSYGWQNSVKFTANSTSKDVYVGTVGKSKRIEALKLTLHGMPGYSIKYSGHVQSIGDVAAVTTPNDTAIASAVSIGTVGKAKRLEAVKVELVKVEPTTVAVSSVSAATAKSLAVTFSAPVADTSKAVFTVTRGTSSTIAVSGYTTTWSADKTVATLTQDTKYAADTYKIAVSGIANLSTTANTGTVTVKAQAVTKIKIISTDLIKGAPASDLSSANATFTYAIYDQYGTDMTSSVANSDITASAVTGNSGSTVSLKPSTGEGTVSHAFTVAEAAKTAVVTLVHNATGTVASATLNVVSAASVTSLTFDDTKATYPSGKTKIEVGQGTAVTIPVTALDQYGNKIKSYSQLNTALNVVASSTSVPIQKFSEDSNGNPTFVLNTTGLTAQTTLVITFVNKTTGVTWSKTFDVEKAACAYKIVVNDFAASTLAVGDTGVALAADVYDQFGTQLTKAQIASNKSIIDSWISGAEKLTSLSVDADPNSTTYGELVTGKITDSVGASPVIAKGTTNDTIVVLFNAPGGAVTKNITICPARVVTTINTTATTNLLQGASERLAFVFKDQYDAKISNDDMTKSSPLYGNTAYGYNITVTTVSGDASGLTVTSPSSLALTPNASVPNGEQKDIGYITVQSAVKKTGTYKVAVDLIDSNGTAVSSASTLVNITANNVAGLTYSLATIPTLNGSAAIYAGKDFAATDKADTTDIAATADDTNPYAQKIVVNAVDASGTTYVVNPADIISVTSSDPLIAITGKGTRTNAPYYYVAGQDLNKADGYYKTHNIAGSPDETATLTVSVNTQDGAKTFTQAVKVSAGAPSITKLNVTNKAVAGNATSRTDVSNLTNALTVTFKDLDTAVTGVAINLIGEDQYGVWHDIDTSSADTNLTTATNSTNYAAVKAFTFSGGKFALNNSTGLTLNQNINVTIFVGTLPLKLVVNVSGTDKTAPTITTVDAANVTAANIATWTAPSTTASDNIDGDVTAKIVVKYSSTDTGATGANAVTDLATARTWLAKTTGNTVTVTYSVSDAAGNAATQVTAVFTAAA